MMRILIGLKTEQAEAEVVPSWSLVEVYVEVEVEVGVGNTSIAMLIGTWKRLLENVLSTLSSFVIP